MDGTPELSDWVQLDSGRLEINDYRRELLDRVFQPFVLLGLAALGFGAFLAVRDGQWGFAIVYLALYLASVVLAVATKRLSVETRSAALRKIINQVLTTSYPHWLFEYRRVANWSFAVGVARSMWPRHLLAEYSLSAKDRAWLWAVYVMVTVAGLLFPAILFTRFRVQLADLLRRQQQASPGQA